MRISGLIFAAFFPVLLIAGCMIGQSVPEENAAEHENESTVIDTPRTGDPADSDVPPEIVIDETGLSDYPAELREAILRARKTIAEKKMRADANVRTARKLAKEKKYIEALSHAEEACKLDRTNTDATDLANKLRARLGKPALDTGDGLVENVRKIRARRELVRRELVGRCSSAEAHMRNGRYTDAIVDFRAVLRIAAVNRLLLDAGDYEKKAQAGLDEAEDKKRAEDKVREILERSKINEDIRKEVKKRLGQKTREIEKLFEQMNRYRSMHDYERAIEVLNAIKEKDRENEESYLRILDELEKERAHWRTVKIDRETRLQKEQQMLEIDIRKIPISRIFDYRSKEEWRSNVIPRAEREIEHMRGETAITPEDKKVIDLLNIRTLEDFDSEKIIGGGRVGRPTILEVKNYIRTKLPEVEFALSDALAREKTDPNVEENILRLRLPAGRGKMKVYSVLNHIALQLGIAWEVEKGMVFFKTRDEAGKTKLVVRRYEVADIIHTLRDFKGGQVVLMSEDEEGGGAGDDEENYNPLIIQDVGENIDVSQEELPHLKRLIGNLIPPGRDDQQWAIGRDDKTQPAIWTYKNAFLYVRATPEIQEQIERLLQRIRRLWGILVNIETRFITVEKDFLERVGIEWRDLGPIDPVQGLFSGIGDAIEDLGIMQDIRRFVPNLVDAVTSGIFYSTRRVDIGARTDHVINSQLTLSSLSGGGGLAVQAQLVDDISFQAILRAVKQNAQRHLLNAPRITCFNTQQASIYVGIKTAYVKSYKTQGQSVSVPELEFATESTVLDVRPIVSHDRRYVTLFLRPMITFHPEFDYLSYTKDINIFTGEPIVLTVDLPTQDRQELRTVVVVPDGGTVLIGGLAQAEDVQEQSRIPFLHKIPIIGFFFKDELISEARSQLMMLVTVRIIAVDEEEADM